MPLHISKLDAARRQLETSIDMYFRSGDPISTHALACAAQEILTALAKHTGVAIAVSFEGLIDTYVKPEHRAELKDRYREPKNFFKHADRDPNGIVAFSPTLTEFVLFEACEAYVQLVKEMPVLLQAFRVWWLLLNHDWLVQLPPEFKAQLQTLHYRETERALFYSEYLAAYAKIPNKAA